MTLSPETGNGYGCWVCGAPAAKATEPTNQFHAACIALDIAICAPCMKTWMEDSRCLYKGIRCLGSVASTEGGGIRLGEIWHFPAGGAEMAFTLAGKTRTRRIVASTEEYVAAMYLES